MRFCFVKKDFIECDIAPNKLAVVGDDFELTWIEFSQSVNNLCDEFTHQGINQLKFPVIIYGHKSANMLVAMYAMMKLELAYIPIDIIYPTNRTEKIIAASQSQLILNTTSDKLSFKNISEISLCKDGITSNRKVDTYHFSAKIQDPLIYIIFTSGSTGEPKGVQISTSAIQSFVRWMSSDFGFTEADVFINSAILSFDLSVFEVMTFAAIGATILLNKKECSGDPNLFMTRIQKFTGSVWVSTPSFALIYSRMVDEPLLSSIKTFLFCGEVLPHGLAKSLNRNFKQAKIINTYGPTEATVATTLIEITVAILENYNPLPVGFSKRESQLLIENDEIVIIGDNVSIGYLNDPELNAKKFAIIDGKRAFRTGDKGILKDGMFFFSGRDDDFVKLHGYRIELNEITTAINNLEYVFKCETLALKRNETVKKIVSLIQLKNATDEISVEKIKKDIAVNLPSYMIPADIKFITEIPLNQNGKTDKKLLTQLFLEA
jgi:D-alanine--poly(phosphoribitol) ligase subunit 1